MKHAPPEYRSLCSPPPGLIAVYANEDGSIYLEPVLALAICARHHEDRTGVEALVRHSELRSVVIPVDEAGPVGIDNCLGLTLNYQAEGEDFAERAAEHAQLMRERRQARAAQGEQRRP